MKQTINLITLGLLLMYGLGFSNYEENFGWSFESGNLITDYSFEHLTTEICKDLPVSSSETQTNCHVLSTSAASGNYVMEVDFKNYVVGGSGEEYSQKSEYLSVEPDKSYTLAFKYQSAFSESITAKPKVCWYTIEKNEQGCSYGSAYTNTSSAWTDYTYDFNVASTSHFIRVYMITATGDGNTGGQGDDYKFDNLKIFETNLPDGVTEVRSYSDASGKVVQTIHNDEIRNLITKTDFDSKGRVSKSYLPIIQYYNDYYSGVFVSTLSPSGVTIDYTDFTTGYNAVKTDILARPSTDLPSEITFYVVVTSSAGHSVSSWASGSKIESFTTSDSKTVWLKIKTVWDGTDEYNDMKKMNAMKSSASMNKRFTGDFSTLQGYQYPGESNLNTLSEYPVSQTNSTLKSYGVGLEYSTRPSSTGRAFISNSTIPDDAEHNPKPGTSAEASYSYQWGKNPQGHYTVQIRDDQGRVIKSGVNKRSNTTIGQGETEDDVWVYQTYVYNDLNQVTSETSPEGIVTSYTYNARGAITSVVDVDRGTTEYEYNNLGQLRFTAKTTNSNGIAYRYDDVGRVIGKAKINWNTRDGVEDGHLPAELDIYTVYDEFNEDEFSSITGITYSSIGFDPTWIKNGQGKVVASFNRNSEVTIKNFKTTGDPNDNFGTADKMAASFFSYDSLGRKDKVYKYVGLVPSDKKWHLITYDYNNDGTVDRTVYKTEDPTDGISLKTSLDLDKEGRVTDVLDVTDAQNPEVLAAYYYDDFGSTEEVGIYDKLNVKYKYDLWGKVTTRSVSSPYLGNEVLYSEFVGYERKPQKDVATSLLTTSYRYDGKVTSLVKSYSKGVSDEVALHNYAYDIKGNLSNSYRRYQDNNLNSDGSIDFANLSISATYDKYDVYNTDHDMGLTYHQRWDGSTNKLYDWSYDYSTGNHKLDKIDVTETSEPSKKYVFTYDEGKTDNLTFKKSDDTEIYELTDIDYQILNEMPDNIDKGGNTSYYLYDSNGDRAATVTLDANQNLQIHSAYIYESYLKVAKEIVEVGTEIKVKTHLYGRGPFLGIVEETTRQTRLVVKDRLGSIVQVMDESNGDLISEKDFQDYGEEMVKLASSETNASRVSESFTGKEKDIYTDLFYFGARYFDDELGLWMKPDPAGQFNNPYSYGGDPINGVDNDGMLFAWADKIYNWVKMGDDCGYETTNHCRNKHATNYVKNVNWDLYKQIVENGVGYSNYGFYQKINGKSIWRFNDPVADLLYSADGDWTAKIRHTSRRLATMRLAENDPVVSVRIGVSVGPTDYDVSGAVGVNGNEIGSLSDGGQDLALLHHMEINDADASQSMEDAVKALKADKVLQEAADLLNKDDEAIDLAKHKPKKQSTGKLTGKKKERHDKGKRHGGKNSPYNPNKKGNIKPKKVKPKANGTIILVPTHLMPGVMEEQIRQQWERDQSTCPDGSPAEVTEEGYFACWSLQENIQINY